MMIDAGYPLSLSLSLSTGAVASLALLYNPLVFTSTISFFLSPLHAGTLQSFLVSNCSSVFQQASSCFLSFSLIPGGFACGINPRDSPSSPSFACFIVGFLHCPTLHTKVLSRLCVSRIVALFFIVSIKSEYPAYISSWSRSRSRNMLSFSNFATGSFVYTNSFSTSARLVRSESIVDCRTTQATRKSKWVSPSLLSWPSPCSAPLPSTPI